MKYFGKLMTFVLCLAVIVLLTGFTQIEKKEACFERYISVELISSIIIQNNGVGEDWTTYLGVRDNIIQEGEKAIIKLEKRAPLIIEAHAIEEDKDYSDEGSNSMIFTYSDLVAIDESRFELNVKVMENGGRRAGNLAEWIFLFELAKAKL